MHAAIALSESLLFHVLSGKCNLSTESHQQEKKQNILEKIVSNWRSKLRHSLPVAPIVKTVRKPYSDVYNSLDKMLASLESLWINPDSISPFPVVRKNKVKQNRLSEFLYNISVYLQNQESQEQEAETWESLLHQLFQVPVERSPTLPLVNLQDFLVSLRASQNWSTLLNLIQIIVKVISSSNAALQLLSQNWEMITGLLDTLFQALLSGTLTQTSTALQGVLCSLMGHSNCGFNPNQLQKILLHFEANNWKPIINIQSGSSAPSHEKYRPLSMLPGSFKDKHPNFTRINSSLNPPEVQNVLEIFYRSRNKEKEIKPSTSNEGPDYVVWKVLEDLRQSLLQRMERSAYDTLNRKVSRMTGSLMSKVSSVIGVPQYDKNGKCFVGNIQQLLLWGIKHNITWNIKSVDLTSTNFPPDPPIFTCSRSAGILDQSEGKAHHIDKRSELSVKEEPHFYSEVLEAVCNDTIPGLPGVSNFTIFLYCNIYNETGYSVQSTYDLKAACADAAWYLSSMEEDSFWVWVCREYFPLEFNVTVCRNASLVRSSLSSSLMSDLCSNISSSSDAVRELRNSIRCSDVWQGTSMNPKTLKTCLFENKTIWVERLCNNDTFSAVAEDTKVSISKFCSHHSLKSNEHNRTISSCQYKTWGQSEFRNATLVEECRGINVQEFVENVCQNITLYGYLKPTSQWIAEFCREKNSSEDGKCFLQRLADMLPLSRSFDLSQLCKNPISYILRLVSQLSQCDSESAGWALNVHYLLKILDFLFTLSDLDQIGKGTRDRLGEAILLSSLLDNSSFWASFKMNSSLSIIQDVEWYLEQENNGSDKEDLLSCFSPVLWELMQKEDNVTAFQILLQEYLQMPREGFQKVLMSAENDAMEHFLSLMHRSWPQIKVSKANGKGLEALTSMVIQKFPILTPKIFIDLAQFIPFMSVSDIVNFPPSLLANQSVLDAIRIYSPDMKLAQKRAFAKRLMQANMFGDISSWPPYFLRSIQPLLPYLPFCHFVQLTPDQIKLLADGWNDVKLEMVQGRHVALSLMNTSRDNTEDQLQSLGSFSCYLTYEDLEDILPLQYPLRQLEKNLLECINEGIISPFGRVAYALVDLLKRVNVHAMDHSELISLRGLLPELGVGFFQRLTDSQVVGLLPKLHTEDLSAAQALFTLLKHITPKKNVAELVICRYHSLIPALGPELLSSLSPSLLNKACQCLRPSLSLLSAPQKAALMQTLRRYTHEREIWPLHLACLLPLAPLKLLHLDTQMLLRNMSLYGELAWMPQQTQFLWKKIQTGSNLTKSTILTLGSLANGIECDILQQLNTIAEIREVAIYLHGIPSGLHKGLRKCILEELQRRPGISWEDTAWLGPEFISDLPVKLIGSLSNESMKQFLEHVHKHPRSFFELPLHKKTALTQRALNVLQNHVNGEINVEELNLLGPLIGYVGEENVAHINRRHLLLNLEELASYCLSDEFISQLGNMLTEEDMLGHPTQWTRTDIEAAGRLIFYLTTENMNLLPKEMLSRDTLEWLLESQRLWEESEMGTICTKQSAILQDKLRRNKVILTSSMSRTRFRGNREPIPTCADMRVTFPSAWTAAQITGMAASEFEDCLGLICRDTELTGEQARAALAKIKQLFGPVKTMSPVLILQMGNLPMHINDKELQEMEIPDWGVVSYLSHMENWTPKQMRILVSSILRQTRKTASDLDLTELTALGHLICGLGVEDLKKINTREFSQAAVFVGTLKLKCSETQLETLAELLTSSSAFGVVSRWGPEIFTEIGTLAAGLPDIVLSSVIRDQIKGLTPSAISLIPAQKFAVVFSPAQLSVFTSDQAAAVTPEQYDHLNYQQRQAISTAKYEGDVHQDPRGENSGTIAWRQNLAVYFITILLILM
ncbi:stereocilin [Xenopus tropicalis]|uniref:Stereocilin n=2 Tax=Xenopus tropicalis TaxID=8364 RepID=A0A8J1JAM9_XENTR|nr:stereocilin [Xenopus tropicalis]